MTRLRHTSQHAVAFAIVVRELLDGPCTARELAEETGMRPETVLGWIRAMRRQHVIYVCHWVEDSQGRRGTAAYALGGKADAPRRPVPRQTVVRDYKARVKLRNVAQAINHRIAA